MITSVKIKDNTKTPFEYASDIDYEDIIGVELIKN